MNRNDGTLTNPTFVAGTIDNAIQFSSYNPVIINNPVGYPSKAISLTSWVKADATISTDFVVTRNNPESSYLCVRTGGRNPDFDLYIDGAWRFCSSPSSIDTNWHHIVGTYDSEGDRILRTYVDGTLKTTRDISTLGLSNYDVVSTLTTTRIGAAYDGRYAQGLIEDFRVYNRALSSGEIYRCIGS